ncbi:protein FAM72A [Vairimorpha necatrix]|uniref:Protein FAM72A n=1 Tax=Vairimorpha necatrix TaxID=6039 RepID=A0AAX4JBC6_9MICR
MKYNKSSFKYVYSLKCRSCCKYLSFKSMKSVLISNSKIKLFSTNYPTSNVRRSGSTYTTRSCTCLISNIICIKCLIVLGYNILVPCKLCLRNKNNGHLWMFDIKKVYYDIIIRGMRVIRWIKNIIEEYEDIEIKIR